MAVVWLGLCGALHEVLKWPTPQRQSEENSEVEGKKSPQAFHRPRGLGSPLDRVGFFCGNSGCRFMAPIPSTLE